ncbi:hypothetical protein L3V83_07565 [Thiotrichales bacterium 19X7-9]|nr:hypothetical protein [Thiotrichales bacterium 19X7-9]
MTREVLKANIANGQFGMVSQVRVTNEAGFQDGIYAEKEKESTPCCGPISCTIL